MKQMKRITLRLSLENPSDKRIADFLANIDKNKYHTVNNAIKTILFSVINNTNADYVAIIDADLQDPPELIVDMYKKSLEGYDIVYAKRLKRDKETAFKKLTAYGFYRRLMI